MNVGQIIDALGGTGAVARKLGMLSSRVSNWRNFGQFPNSVTVYRQISALCEEKGIELDGELFGQRRNQSAA